MNEVEKRKLKELARAIAARNKVRAAYWLGQCDALGIVGTSMQTSFNCDTLTNSEAIEASEYLHRLTQ